MSIAIERGRAHVIVVGRYVKDGAWEATDTRTGETQFGTSPHDAVAQLTGAVPAIPMRGVPVLKALDVACVLVGLCYDELVSPSRNAAITSRRMVVWWLMRNTPEGCEPYSLPQIAGSTGRAGHAHIAQGESCVEKRSAAAHKKELLGHWHRCLADLGMTIPRLDRERWMIDMLLAVATRTRNPESLAI